MSTEIDRIIIELLKSEISDEETYRLAEELYRAYKEGGQRKVREYILKLLRDLGIEDIENE